MEDNEDYNLIHREDVSRSEAFSFAFRLLWAALTAPVLTYEYLRAVRIEGYTNPKMLWQAVRLRLGANAVLYAPDPLQPKQVGRVIYDHREGH